jgi:putative protease
MKDLELLAPAGDYEKLQTAYDFGADAAYVGSQRFGLRSAAGNFSFEELARARQLAADRQKKLFLTLNAYLVSGQFEQLAEDIETLKPLDLDAYIISDPGVLSLVRRIDPDREIHLSTQANTTNVEAIRFWQQHGVSRVNLARELTLEEIQAIGEGCDIDLEAFVHGAMCVAYSGRCLLSAALNDRSANAGACSHPCRWNYALVEEQRPGEYHAIEEDEHGTYIMNSRDLRLVEHLPQLIEAGIDSFKIEGRMKSRYYVAVVTRVYREALDRYRENPDNWRCDPLWLAELDKVSHRPYDSGFLFGHDDAKIHSADTHYQRSFEFVGQVLAIGEDGRALVLGKNRFFPGERLEIFGPQMRQAEFEVGEVTDEGGQPLEVVQPNARVRMSLPAGSQVGDMMRVEKDQR